MRAEAAQWASARKETYEAELAAGTNLPPLPGLLLSVALHAATSV